MNVVTEIVKDIKKEDIIKLGTIGRGRLLANSYKIKVTEDIYELVTSSKYAGTSLIEGICLEHLQHPIYR